LGAEAGLAPFIKDKRERSWIGLFMAVRSGLSNSRRFLSGALHCCNKTISERVASPTASRLIAEM
jgi:hypothetical protein